MRRRLLFLSPCLLGLFGSFVFACEDDPSNKGTGQFDPDSGVFDAPPPPVVTPPDAEADAGPPPVTVLVTRLGLPRSGVRVVFHDAAGAVLETKLTGTDGKAQSATGTAPSMASALLGGGLETNILTWVQVEPGDELAATDESGGAPDVGTLSVTLPGTHLGPPAATLYEAMLGDCTNGAATAIAPITVNVAAECALPQPAVLGRALQDSETVVAYATAKPALLPPPDGGTSSVTTSAWTAPVNVTLSATTLADAFVTAQYADIAGPRLFRYPATPTLSGAPVVFPAAPAGFADAVQSMVVAELDTPLGARKTMAVRAAPAATFAFNLADALPTITGATVVATDKLRPEVSWTSGASLASTDGGAVRVPYSTGADSVGYWSFVVPPGAGSVKAPAMPPEAAGWVPVDVDGGFSSNFEPPEVTFVEAEALPSYASFRRAAGVILGGTASGRDTNLILPQSGAVRTTFYQFADGL